MPKLLFKLAVLSAMLLGLPLLGVALSGRPLAPYLEFPPLTRYVQHAPFSWVAFALFSILTLLLLAGIAFLLRPVGDKAKTSEARHPFPRWGWPALALLGLFWTVAWNRFGWFSTLQPYTFTPLWLAYIVSINAVTQWRTGHCLLIDRPAYFLALFPFSALFWWYFEFLNRFVQNWYYVGIEGFSPLQYSLHATAAFSTVLPAVLSTMRCLQSFPRLTRSGYRQPLRTPQSKSLAWSVLSIAAAGLACIGIWPDYLFPLLWVAPLLLIVCLQVVQGESSYLSALNRGEWHRLYLPALAALMCGLLWEMWNLHSHAKWIYAIPYVDRFHLFEMPLLGYAGYLTFGLECVVIADLVSRLMRGREGAR